MFEIPENVKYEAADLAHSALHIGIPYSLNRHQVFFPGQTLVILRSSNCAVDTAYASQCSKYQEMSNMTPRILTAAPAQYDAHVSLLMGRPFGLTAKPF